MYDSNPLETYTYLFKELEKKKVAFIDIKEANDYDAGFKQGMTSGKEQMPDVAKVLRPFFNGVIINNDGFTPQTGLEKMKSGIAQAIAFGRLGITNPDLPNRIKNNYPLNNNLDFSTFYGGGAKGYTEYTEFKN